MTRRSYEQYCPLARALDLVGERWTLLVVRDLMAGPKRYSDLHRGLPGLGTDLLTERLRGLEQAGLLRRRKLDAPVAATVYELTERGRELEPAVLGLARFGLALLGGPPGPDELPGPDRFALLLRVLFRPDQAPAGPETWTFEGGGPGVAATVRDGEVAVKLGVEGLPEPPAARFMADPLTLYALVGGGLDAASALADGTLAVEGDRAALERMRATFAGPAAV